VAIAAAIAGGSFVVRLVMERATPVELSLTSVLCGFFSFGVLEAVQQSFRTTPVFTPSAGGQTWKQDGLVALLMVEAIVAALWPIEVEDTSLLMDLIVGWLVTPILIAGSIALARRFGMLSRPLGPAAALPQCPACGWNSPKRATYCWHCGSALRP
jgi:hypothetical protein